MRKVRTAEGSRYYGLPIGAPITADAIARARARNKGAGSFSPANGSSSDRSGASRGRGSASVPKKVITVAGREYHVPQDAVIEKSTSPDSPNLYAVAPDESVRVYTPFAEALLDDDFADRVLERLSANRPPDAARPTLADTEAPDAPPRARPAAPRKPSTPSPSPTKIDEEKRPQRPEGADPLDVLDSPYAAQWLNPDGTIRSTERVTVSKAVENEIRVSAEESIAAHSAVEPEVTKELSVLANQFDADLVGLEYRLKAVDSLSDKIRRNAYSAKVTPSEAAERLCDVLRYTMRLPDSNYTEGIRAVLEDFKRRNHGIDLANSWIGNPNYRGVNVVLTRPDGTQFELQFHTADSFHVKDKINHSLYEKWRELPPGKEKDDIAAEMQVNASSIPVPPGIEELTEYNKKIEPKRAEE